MRSIVLLVAVGVLALLGGVVVTGLPSTVPNDFVASQISTTTAPAITAAPTTISVAPPTQRTSAATTASSSTTATTVAATATTLRVESSLRVVVANATDASGLATSTAEQLRSAGYTGVTATDATQARQTTGIVYAPGFEGEALRLATLLELSAQQITPRPDGQLTLDDAPGDLWVLIGLDRA